MVFGVFTEGPRNAPHLRFGPPSPPGRGTLQPRAVPSLPPSQPRRTPIIFVAVCLSWPCHLMGPCNTGSCAGRVLPLESRLQASPASWRGSERHCRCGWGISCCSPVCPSMGTLAVSHFVALRKAAVSSLCGSFENAPWPVECGVWRPAVGKACQTWGARESPTVAGAPGEPPFWTMGTVPAPAWEGSASMALHLGMSPSPPPAAGGQRSGLAGGDCISGVSACPPPAHGLAGGGHRPTGHRAARQARQDSEAIRAAVTREGK